MRRLERLTEEEATSPQSRPRQRPRKLAVLQASAEKIEKLQAQLRKVEESANAEEKRLQRLVDHLSQQVQGHSTEASAVQSFVLPDSSAEWLRFVTDRHSLHANKGAQSRLALLTLDLTCDTIVDANQYGKRTPPLFLTVTLCHPSHFSRCLAVPLCCVVSFCSGLGGLSLR